MSNINNDEVQLRQTIANIDCEISKLEENIEMINQTCGKIDARTVISLGRFWESISVLQERIEKLRQMRQRILINLNAILSSQMTEAQCE